MTSIPDISRRLSNNLNKIEKDFEDVTEAANQATLQYKQLSQSNQNSTPGSVEGGIHVKATTGKRFNNDGSVSATGIGVFGTKLDTFGSLTGQSGGVQTIKTVTSTNPDGASAAFNKVIGGMGNLTKQQLHEAAVTASEGLSDSSDLPAGSSTKPLITDAAAALRARSDKMLAFVDYKTSILEDMVGDPNLVNNIYVSNIIENLGESTINLNNMANIPPRTYLQTYGEIEAYLRSSRRDYTEVMVHATDTTRDQVVDYDVVKKWDTDRGFSDAGYHFLIQPDGSIEVCRPIFKTGAHTLHGHNPNSIGIAFVGGLLGNRFSDKPRRSRKSYTVSQWKSFDIFMKAFYSVVPGGQAWGHNSIDPTRRSDPYFDVPKYVEKKFNKKNTQTLEETRRYGSLTINELIEAQY